MLSEFENNLIAEVPVILDRKGRRWSLARQGTANNTTKDDSVLPNRGTPQLLPPEDAAAADQTVVVPSQQRRGSRELPSARGGNKWRLVGSNPKRVITVIDEASV